MNRPNNPYSELGVSENASPEEIKNAYRKLAKRYHPDLNPGDKSAAEKLIKINEAYSILSDPKKKAQYDGTGDRNFGPDFKWEGSIFEEMNFAGGKATPKAAPPIDGSDIDITANLTFADSYFGCKKTFSVKRFVCCQNCGGSGATAIALCQECNGKGGKNVISKFNIKIPPGIVDGKVVTAVGRGNEGKNKGNVGSLRIHISVEKDEYFTVVDNDLHCKVDISFVTAILGGEISVRTMRGSASLSVPAGTQPGTCLRIKGHGFPRPNNQGFNDLYVTLNIVIPKYITREQRQLLLKFDTYM